jgi:hypothetical protein
VLVHAGEGEVALVHERPSLNITLNGEVCQECNNVTLGGLERDVEPILKPMIRDCTATSIAFAEQRLLSAWAVKTVYLLELAVRQKYAGVRPIEGLLPSEPEFAWMWKTLEPPPRSRVWLACFDAQMTTRMMYEPSGAPIPALGGDRVEGQFTSFSLGYVAFQVFAVNFVEADAQRAAEWIPPTPPDSVRSALAQIWPPHLEAVHWPLPAFAHEDWNRLVTWEGCLRNPRS